MTARIVHTQAELDQAVTKMIGYIDIESEPGIWLTVRACDSSTVTAYDSSTVTAYDSSTVRARPSVAVHLHSRTVCLSGGTVIDHTKEITDADEWCRWHGITVSKAGVATVYKSVGGNWESPHGTRYAPGTKPACNDWADDNGCGGGLHFSPTPMEAQYYFDTATRFVEVGVRVSELRPIPGGTPKCKAPRVVRACREVDIDGKRI